MILVFGGTTEGKLVSSILEAHSVLYTYSTKTKVAFSGKGRYISGVMTKTSIEDFCRLHGVTHIINAAHPFAENLHQTIASISVNIPLIRFERAFPIRVSHELVTYVNSFEEAIDFFEAQQYKTLLSLSGVQTIEKLARYWKQNKTWFRILDRTTSRSIAEKAGFPKSQLVFGFPQEEKEEIKLFKRYKPSVILTKESGANGKLSEKINAAIKVQTPIVILKKPILSNLYICTRTKEELLKYIQ